MPINILTEPDNLLLAQTLTDLIDQENKLTPAALARKLGIPTNKITRILNGDVTDPKASTLLQIASYFGTELAAFDLNPDQEFFKKYNVQISTIQEIFRVSDVVSIHLPLTQETKGLIGAELLTHMKKDAVILNYSRGGIVNEIDLINHLENNKFAGAAVDVFEIEPSFKTRLFELSNVIATPHIGGSTEESIMAMGNSAIDKLVAKIV
jgi:phosphoglycerate dehydrogenase-like enzyme